METGQVAIVDNLGGALGDYSYRREAAAFEGALACLRLEGKRELPADAAGWAGERRVRGLVIGGALESPLDKEQWIRREEEFVRDFLKLGLPVLGICFGHEIIGSALGAKLGRHEALRVELDRIEATKNDPIFAGFDCSLSVPVAHSVMLLEIPDGFERIGRSEKCENIVMRHRELPVYGVQFHPEADREIKEHDPDWNPISDEDFGRSDGARVMENFREIVLNFDGGLRQKA